MDGKLYVVLTAENIHPGKGTPVTQLNISATQIRALLARGHSPRYLLPEAVLAYIHDRALYRALPVPHPAHS